ncbi:MAG: TIR domain-containing protein [Acidimicrobiia bacterium]|nr:TIR domain-containing protein [Acidimicrobiia bacterium]
MAHDVFVSYSAKDKLVADAIVARLEQDSIRCWIASRDIAPGTSWGDSIVAAIAASRIMVLVLSANSNRSRQVVREVQRAVADDVIILPFRIEDIDPTGAMAYFLGTEHWLDALTPPLERHLERLRATVAALVSGSPLSRGDLDTPPSVVAKHRRRAWLPYAVGGAVAVAAVAGTLAIMSGRSEPTGTSAAESVPTTTTTTTTLPVALREVGRYQPMDIDLADARSPDAIYGIDVAGNMLVYANGIDGVTRASLGDPAQPRPLETFAAYDAREVAFDGEWIYALLGEYSSELSIFNVDGTGGVTIDSTDGSLSYLTLAGDHLYVSTHDYVGIIDVTDPLNPAVVTEWQAPDYTGNPATVFVDGDVGYFGAGWDGLYVFDVSDPSSLIALSHWPSPNWVTAIYVEDGRAFVSLGSTGVAVLDVEDPQHPILLGLAEVPGFASRLVVAHGHAFVAWFGESGTLGGVAVIDVRDSENPLFLETYGRFQTISGREILGDNVIVADEAGGLIVFEITGVGG